MKYYTLNNYIEQLPQDNYTVIAMDGAVQDCGNSSALAM